MSDDTRKNMSIVSIVLIQLRRNKVSLCIIQASFHYTINTISRLFSHSRLKRVSPLRPVPPPTTDKDGRSEVYDRIYPKDDDQRGIEVDERVHRRDLTR